MKITIDPKDYMGGRITVMGIASILITWFRSGIVVPAGSWLEFFKVTGDIGVDLFLFASGVGIYLAVNKYASYWQYLFRRVRRVLIPYLCVCVPLYYYEMRMFGGGYSLLLKRILMLDFWTACNLESWYIASILTLYLITPFWIRLWKKYSWLHVGTFVAVLFCVAFLWDLPFFVNWKVFLGRIPVYLLGLTFGKLLLEKKTVTVSVPLLAVATVCGTLLVQACTGRLPRALPIEYKYIGYLPVALCLSLAFVRIPANKVTNYFGVRSLEIYLIFEKVQEILVSKPQMEMFMGKTGIALNLIILAITLICAEILRWICKLIDWVLNKLS